MREREREVDATSDRFPFFPWKIAAHKRAVRVFTCVSSLNTTNYLSNLI